MVASDVARRGLDIHEISYVVNFDMPNNIDKGSSFNNSSFFIQ